LTVSPEPSDTATTSTALVKFKQPSDLNGHQKSRVYNNIVILLTLYRTLDVGLMLMEKEAIIPVPKHGKIHLPQLKSNKVCDPIYIFWWFRLNLFRFDLSLMIAVAHLHLLTRASEASNNYKSHIPRTITIVHISTLFIIYITFEVMNKQTIFSGIWSWLACTCDIS
jgi:hypothetical protein